jgi:hypothetical protein
MLQVGVTQQRTRPGILHTPGWQQALSMLLEIWCVVPPSNNSSSC